MIDFYFDFNGTPIRWTYKGAMEDTTSPLYRAYHHVTYKPKLNDFKIIDPQGHNINDLKKALLESVLDTMKTIDNKKPKSIWVQ